MKMNENNQARNKGKEKIYTYISSLVTRTTNSIKKNRLNKIAFVKQQ